MDRKTDIGKGAFLKLSEPADFKTDPDLENCSRFVGVIEQNKI